MMTRKYAWFPTRVRVAYREWWITKIIWFEYYDEMTYEYMDGEYIETEKYKI